MYCDVCTCGSYCRCVYIHVHVCAPTPHIFMVRLLNCQDKKLKETYSNHVVQLPDWFKLYRTVCLCVMGWLHMLGGVGRVTRINSRIWWHRTLRHLTAEQRGWKDYWFKSVTPHKVWFKNSPPTRRWGWRSLVLLFKIEMSRRFWTLATF